MRLAVFLFAIGLVAVSSASAHQNDLANEFASKGMFFTLKECNLPKTCGGKPFVEQKKVKRWSSNDDFVDQRTLKFDGLKVDFLYVLKYSPDKPAKNPYRRPKILELTITKPSWPVAHGLHVGVSRASVVRVLGQGHKQGSLGESECLEYVNVEKQDSVMFCFKNNKVSKIHWVPWYD